MHSFSTMTRPFRTVPGIFMMHLLYLVFAKISVSTDQGGDRPRRDRGRACPRPGNVGLIDYDRMVCRDAINHVITTILKRKLRINRWIFRVSACSLWGLE